MSAPMRVSPTRPHSDGWRATARRVETLAGTEVLLLRRTPAALFIAAAMPVTMVLLFRVSMPPELAAASGTGAFIVTSLAGATLILVVYYNLVTSLVARREDLVLKRLRAGELSDGEIIAGTAAPAVVIAWAQLVLGFGAAVAAFDLGWPTNPLLVLAALAGGTALFVLLALVSAGLTRNVSASGFTTAPLLVVSMALSGLMLPVSALPVPLEQVARLLPLTPVVDLLQLGLTGTAADGRTVGLSASFAAAVVPLLILGGWITASLVLARRWFRWEPRR